MNKNFCKLMMVLPVVLLADWILMILLGCVAGACNVSDHFFCSAYCYAGFSLLFLSVAVALFLVCRKKLSLH